MGCLFDKKKKNRLIKPHCGDRVKVFKDAELKVLLDEDALQTQGEYAEVTQQAVSKRLKTMRMIQKQGKCATI